jgi:hypothetical protein
MAYPLGTETRMAGFPEAGSNARSIINMPLPSICDVCMHVMYVHMYVCMHVMHVHMYVCMHVIHVHMYACVAICEVYMHVSKSVVYVCM